MSGINKVILVGRLGKNPDIRTFETGAKRASFTMATSEYRKDKDGNKIELTEWHNIVCWRNLAEVAEKYLQKESRFTWKESCALAVGRKMVSSTTSPKLRHQPLQC